MEHSSSELLSPASELLRAHKLLLKDSSPAETTIKEVTKVLAKVILDLNSSPPRQPLRAVVDNTPSGSASGDISIVDSVGNENTGGNDCSAVPEAVAAWQVSPLTPPVSVPTPSPRTINDVSRSALVIANDKSVLKITKELLKHEGYSVHSAPDGVEGLRLYGRCAPFDLVLIDYYVPETDGVEIDYCAPQKDGIKLALAISKINPSQRMILAALDYQHPDQVPRPTELMHIPVLINTRQLRELFEKFQYWATREEIDQAIAALSPAEWLKLEKSAAWRVWGQGRSASDKGKDLLQDALLSTFIGAQGNGSGRRWNKRVDFVMHLTGAMRGISSHWKDKSNEREVLECEAVRCDAEGQEFSPLDNLSPGDTRDERLRVAAAEGFQPAAERRLIAKEEIEKLFRMFMNDKEATLVLQGFSEGKKKNEIVQKYELTAKQYDAAIKRIRVKLSGPANGGGGEEHGR